MKVSVSRPIFIALAWPYVNGDIHIGHAAGYLLPADIVARFYRQRGHKVLMVSGSDCYGTPITLEADKRQVTPQELIDEYHPKVQEAHRALGMSYDLYTKTATKNHSEVVQKVFKELFAKGYIYKGVSIQYYSESDNRFLPDRYVEGTCGKCGYVGARSDQCDKCGAILEKGDLIEPYSLISKAKVDLRESEHYFIRYDSFQEFLSRYVKEKGVAWKSWVVSESEKWLKEGLRGREITRDLDWGVEIPDAELSLEDRLKGSEGKRLYVWFDAVIGYLSAAIEWSKLTGNSYEEFFYNEEAYHYYFLGKDNLVFHTLFWPAYLHGFDANINLPDVVSVNHFLSLEGEKFSKSRGVYIGLQDLTTQYGVDESRFYLASILPESSDANFTFSGLKAAVNNRLVAKIGNFFSRTCKVGEGAVLKKDIDLTAIEGAILHCKENLERAIFTARVRDYVEELNSFSDFCNEYITKVAPWKLKKEQLGAFTEEMSRTTYLLLSLGVFMRPILINASKKVEEHFQISLNIWPENFLVSIGELVEQVTLKEIDPLFKKIEIALEERG
jgi:methionyl-tRNA synthetase